MSFTPERIASLQPSITLTLERLGRLDRLVACTKYCVEALPELADRPVKIIADSWSSTMDELVAVAPTLVIASVPYRMESLAAILRAGCPVLTLAPHTLSDILADIRLLASVVDARDRGELLIAEMEAEIARVREQAARSTVRPRIYCEEWGKPLIHSQPWVAELVAAAGGEFVGQPGKTTIAEEVAAADPDVLVFAWCGAGDRVPLARVIEQRGWDLLRAVRDRRVYCVPDEFLNTPAHTVLEGLACLAATLHPNLFPSHPRLVSLADSRPEQQITILEEMEQDVQTAISAAAEKPRPRAVVAALILRGKQVLICQRKAGTAMGLQWEFPGGKIEAGETPEEALHRELEEELGIDANIGPYITDIQHAYRNGGSIHLRFFAVHHFEGEIRNRVFEDMRWAELQDLPGYNFLAADRKFIRDLAEGKIL